MALVQLALIWVVYAVVVGLLAVFSLIFAHIYQKPRERAASITIVSVLTLTSLLATVLLLPVDVALVSSTVDSKLGQRKEWASQQKIDDILLSIKVLYYILLALDALLCLIAVPFTYFWFEEYDEVDAEEGQQTVGQRFKGAIKYTLGFVVLVVILFLVGFFVPIASRKGEHVDLDFFKRLLAKNHLERALTFDIGLLTALGVLLYVLYTASGLALLPIVFIKTAPSISAPSMAADAESELEANRERQRQLEGRREGHGLSPKEQRELDALVRDERTLRRRQRLAAEESGEHESSLVRAWYKVCAVFRPLKLLFGILLMLVVLLVWVSMLLTGIDKARNSVCKSRCGYVLGHIEIFNPVNWILVQAARVFPIDYAIFLLLTLLFFCSSIIGIGVVGVRFLWVSLFQIRKGHTSPQALLISTVMLALISLAINYALSMMVAPQYSHYGTQTFCDHPPARAGAQPDCSDHKNHIIPCSEAANNAAAKNVCTASVSSTFMDRITVNFTFFGGLNFWAQFAFLAVFLAIFITSLFKTPKLDQYQLEQDALEEEEEGLLSSTRRRFGATWQDVTGRSGGTQEE